MNPTAPRPASPLIQTAGPVAAPAGPSLLSKIIVVLLTLLAVAAICFVKDNPRLIAGGALVATVVGLAAVYLKNHYEEAPVVTDSNAEEALFDALATNRAEYINGLSTLKAGLDVATQDRTASRENEMIRQELGRARTELASLRAAVTRN